MNRAPATERPIDPARAGLAFGLFAYGLWGVLPIYFKPQGTDPYQTVVLRCTFDGEELRLREVGTPVALPVARGVYEPSITRFGGTTLVSAFMT